MNFGVFIVLLLNFGLVYFFSGSVYYFVGIFYTFIAILLTLLLKKSTKCYVLINIFVKNWENSELIGEENGNMILLSVAFLIGAIKIGAAIALFVEVSAILFLALAILLATGFWFDGYKSGMTISGAYYISKFAVKIFELFNSLFDRIMELIVKIEFIALGIDKK
ncbi:MAG: hypothetical protein HFG36_11335 [Eubacterium sp.]|nr:hypothetical protein [Eubacterium sp.]